MRPSRLFLWLALAALLFALFAAVSPWLQATWALWPFGFLVGLFVLDVIISPGPWRCTVTPGFEREVFAGEETVLHLAFHSGNPPDTITGVLSPSEGLSGPDEFLFENGTAAVRLTARRRGQWAIEHIWLRWKSRLRMVEFTPKRPLEVCYNVVPNIRLVTSGQIDLDLQSTLFGAKQTTRRGEGSEFHQLTDYVQGMDPRSIDWKRSARQHTLVAKEMRAERNHQIILALDNGHLMREEIVGLPKIDHKINAALALAWAGIQGGDQVGLFAFDARPRLYCPPLAGRAAFSSLRSQMANLEYRSIETNHTLALSHLHQRISKRSLIVVFSDFVDPLTAELLVEHMAILNRHHVVVFVSLRDPLLSNLTASTIVNMNDVARSVSASHLLEERRLVLDRMAALGIHVIETNPNEMTARLINTYLAIKSKEAI